MIELKKGEVMERISKALAGTVENLRRTVDLLAIVERDTHLRKTGANWYAGPCPFCGGRDRFVLKRTADGWRWLCRHCSGNKYGDAIDYVERREGLDFKAAVRQLGGEVSSPFLRELTVRVGQKPQVNAEEQQDPQTIQRLTKTAYAASFELDKDTSLAAEVRGYLDRRGIIEPTRQRALLGAVMAYDPKAGRKRPAVAIPFLNDALSVRAIKYRFADDDQDGLRYTMERGSQSGFYYLPEALGQFSGLLIVEGELNLLSVAQVLPELDLISTGSQSLSDGMKVTLSTLAGRYRRVYCWFDDPQVAAEVARLTCGRPIQSPQIDGVKWDANRLLRDDLLHDFITKITGVRIYGWTLAGWVERQTKIRR